VFTRPASRPTAARTGYTQKVPFGYSGTAAAGPVYTRGVLHTGDPIFASLVHRLGVQVKYRFASAVQHDIVGTESILLRLTGQSGWSHAQVLVPATHFRGDSTSTVVPLNLRQIEKLVTKVSALTGMDGGYTVSVVPEVHITGTVAGNPLNLSFEPAMNFVLSGTQLASQGATDTVGSSTASSSSGGGLSGSRCHRH
jgi:hypothetical protein